jgi:MoaE-MoaD fusion protein
LEGVEGIDGSGERRGGLRRLSATLLLKRDFMRVKVLFFASLAARVGEREVDVELEEGATVGGLMDVLARKYLAVQEMRGKLAYAVNLEYRKAGEGLKEGDEVAVIPPVSGG